MTWAPGTTAACGSVTRPLMLAELTVSCAPTMCAGPPKHSTMISACPERRRRILIARGTPRPMSVPMPNPPLVRIAARKTPGKSVIPKAELRAGGRRVWELDSGRGLRRLERNAGGGLLDDVEREEPR